MKRAFPSDLNSSTSSNGQEGNKRLRMAHINSTGANPYWDDRGHHNEGDEDEEDEDEEDEERIGAMVHGDIVELEEDESEEEEEYCMCL